MALNFPDTPAIGDIFIANDRAWKWTGSAWEAMHSSLTVDGGTA